MKLTPGQVLDEERPDDGVDPIVTKISNLPAQERTKLWRGLATSRKTPDRHSGATRALALQVEEFVAQIDFLRGEIEAVRKKLR